ncbi:Aste57867_6811 [Aphanomyces stellatus]|uniref:Aste57867_6811 protein n=1 Tax=Aphanomyces stellatus TaxID=120398 RepID=A0A485KFR1_9STRA|nr:hypothetical protein As57867_006791 [Aphanomyces stellatus]VFT83775.1 Aste57867_6811 [Aphanomyces stellatus]
MGRLRNFCHDSTKLQRLLPALLQHTIIQFTTMPSVLYNFFSSTGRRYYPAPATPTLKSNDSVIVEVKAAAINPVDYKLPSLFLHGYGVGIDVAGVVTQVSPDVTTFAVGDRVFGAAKGGSLADRTVCKASELAKLPNSFTFVQGAALPVAYISGYQALANHGFQEGHKVLVIGASGGCGSAGVQLAKAMGASEVVGVCSKKNEEFVKSLGADRIIDYQTQSIGDGNDKHFDFVYDTATNSGGGEDYLTSAKAVLKDPTKHHVALNGPLSMWLRKLTGFPHPTIALIVSSQNSTDLEAIVRHLERSNQRPIIDSEFDFTEHGVEDAFAKLRSRRTKGKIVINLENTAN